jgi:hypothetical protein
MLKRERLYAVLSAVQVAITFAAVVFSALNISLVAVAAARTIVAAGFFAVFVAYATTIAPVRMTDIAGAVWRPTAAGLLMAAAVRTLQTFPAPLPIVGLVRDAALGALVFAAAVILLWMACGRPDGAECVILAGIRERFGRREPATI